MFAGLIAPGRFELPSPAPKAEMLSLKDLTATPRGCKPDGIERDL